MRAPILLLCLAALLLVCTSVEADESSGVVEFMEFNCNPESASPDFCAAYVAAIERYGFYARRRWRSLQVCGALGFEPHKETF